MEYRIYSIPHTIRCVICGSEDITAVCRHCGKPLCQSHRNVKPDKDPTFSFFRRIIDQFICNQEIPVFYQLKIPKRPEKGRFFDTGTMTIDRVKDEIQYLKEWMNYLSRYLRTRISLYIGKPISKGNQQERAAYCEQCIRFARSFYPLVRTGLWIFLCCALATIPVAIGLLFRVFAPLRLIYTFIGMGIGCFLLILGVFLNFVIFLEDQRRNAPDNIQVDCDLLKVKVVERIFGEIKLQRINNEMWRYTSNMRFPRTNSISGEIQAVFLFNEKSCSDIQTFQDKTHLIGKESQAGKIQLGFILLNGVWWRLNEYPEDVKKFGEWAVCRENNSCHQILASASQLDVENILNGTKRGTTVFTKRTFTYPSGVDVIRKIELPVQMIISFSSEIERRALDIEIEILDAAMSGMKGACIHALDLEIPYELGQVATHRPVGRPVTPSSPEFFKISWQNLYFDTKANAGCYRKNIVIQFQEDFPDLSVLSNSACLKGHIEIHYPGLSIRKAAYKSVTYTGRSYSELLSYNAVMIFDAFGNRRDLVDISDFETHVLANFQLDLRGMRPEEEYTDRPAPINKEGVSPNNQVMATIIDKLNAQKIFYIKRVTENPPPVSKENANKVQHYWDMHGRAYEGVFPIDFHIIFTGEEVCDDQSQCTFQAEIYTKAAVTSQDMRKKVRNISVRLSELIQKALVNSPDMKDGYTYAGSDGVSS